MFIVYNDFYCRSLSYQVELVSKKSSKYCEHMNEEDFDIEDLPYKTIHLHSPELLVRINSVRDHS